MLRTPCYVISDAHIGAAPREVEHALLRFLRSLEGDAASLVVNGDLFDFWFEWRTVVPRRGVRAIAALAALRDAGTDVLWIGGNHDGWGSAALEEDFGVRYHLGPWRGAIGEWRTLIEHGDGLRALEDRKYRRLRTVLQHPFSVRAFRWLHPDLGTRLASGSSEASRTHRPRGDGSGLRQVALDALAKEREVDLVVYGHSHVPALERAANGGVYANAGTWLEAPTYLRISDTTIEMMRWDAASSKGVRLDSLDRRAEKTLGHP